MTSACRDFFGTMEIRGGPQWLDSFGADLVTGVTDGDTFRFIANILNVRVEDTCRMNDYNAPELRGQEREQRCQTLLRENLRHGLAIHLVIWEPGRCFFLKGEPFPAPQLAIPFVI